MANNESEIIRLRLEECLRSNGIKSKDYTDLIKALFQAGPKDRAKVGVRAWTRKGNPISYANVSRTFDGITIYAEDRGPVYAVWVMTVPEKRDVQKVLVFTEFPWGQI